MTQRSIKSAERTLRLFELFSRRQERLTVGEIARGLAIPQPSASMLLTNLTGLGYLEYDRFDRTYAPTIRVVLLGSWLGPRLGGRQSLASRLDDLIAAWTNISSLAFRMAHMRRSSKWSVVVIPMTSASTPVNCIRYLYRHWTSASHVEAGRRTCSAGAPLQCRGRESP